MSGVRGRRCLSVASLLLGVVAPACVLDNPSSRNDDSLEQRALSITDGSPAPDDSSVFLVEIETDDGDAICGAALVAPDLLLTAAHCVTAQFGAVDCETLRLGPPLTANRFRATNAANLQTAPEEEIEFQVINEVTVVSPGAPLCGNDLALLRLANDVAPLTASPLAFALSQTDPPEARAVGFGNAHPYGSGERVRRASEFRAIECIEPGECLLATDGAAGAANLSPIELRMNEFSAPLGTCQGDSGGPALSANGSILGILSRGRVDCSASIYTAAQLPPLLEHLRTHFEQRGEPPPQWLKEPSPIQGSANGGAGGSSDTGDGGASTLHFGANQTNPVTNGGCSCAMPGSRQSAPRGAPLLLLLLPLSWFRLRKTESLANHD